MFLLYGALYCLKRLGMEFLRGDALPPLAGPLNLVQLLCLAVGAEVEGRPAAVALAVPDANQVFSHMRGRLWPAGWLRWLWYRRRITQARLLILGVMDEYRGQGLEMLLVAQLARAAVARGYRAIELGWIAEDNLAVQRLIEHVCGPIGVRRYRTYRLYEMPLPGI